MIKQRTLGRTSLQVSELCLGTLNFGWKTDDSQSLAILDAYRAAGGNFIQASGHLPGLELPSASPAFSEDVIGRWWTSRQIPRGDLIIATRINVRQPVAGTSTLVRLAREKCQESLRRLKTAYIDILIFEWNDTLLPMRETLEAFDGLVRSGLVRFIGAANFPVWRVADAIGRAYLRNSCRMELLQADYSLMTRARFELEAMSLCQEQRLGFLARSPLAGGFLAPVDGPTDRIDSTRRDWLEQRFGNAYGDVALAGVHDVAARHQASAAQVALSWVLHNPSVTSAVVGVRSPAQLNELVAAAELAFSAVDLAQLAHATETEEVRVAAEYPPTVPAMFELIRN
jgi:1-deoxyxylulose-5-phosphate synthase